MKQFFRIFKSTLAEKEQANLLTDAYLEPSQPFKMEFLAKIVNMFQLSINLAKEKLLKYAMQKFTSKICLLISKIFQFQKQSLERVFVKKPSKIHREEPVIATLV